LKVPITAFFLPPPDDGISKRYLFHLPAELVGEDCVQMGDLTALAMSEPWDEDSPVMNAYRDRYVSALQAWLPARIGEDLADARGKLTDAEFRARLLDRLQAQRSALAQVIGDIDRQVEAIAEHGGAR
jgi:hypothetical protein